MFLGPKKGVIYSHTKSLPGGTASATARVPALPGQPSAIGRKSKCRLLSGGGCTRLLSGRPSNLPHPPKTSRLEKRAIEGNFGDMCGLCQVFQPGKTYQVICPKPTFWRGRGTCGGISKTPRLSDIQEWNVTHKKAKSAEKGILERRALGERRGRK